MRPKEPNAQYHEYNTGKSAVCSIYTNGFKENDVQDVSVYLNSCGYPNYVVHNSERPILKFTPTGTMALHATICGVSCNEPSSIYQVASPQECSFLT